MIAVTRDAGGSASTPSRTICSKNARWIVARVARVVEHRDRVVLRHLLSPARDLPDRGRDEHERQVEPALRDRERNLCAEGAPDQRARRMDFAARNAVATIASKSRRSNDGTLRSGALISIPCGASSGRSAVIFALFGEEAKPWK
jgi:hypothetical protein